MAKESEKRSRHLYRSLFNIDLHRPRSKHIGVVIISATISLSWTFLFVLWVVESQGRLVIQSIVGVILVRAGTDPISFDEIVQPKHIL